MSDYSVEVNEEATTPSSKNNRVVEYSANDRVHVLTDQDEQQTTNTYEDTLSKPENKNNKEVRAFAHTSLNQNQSQSQVQSQNNTGSSVLLSEEDPENKKEDTRVDTTITTHEYKWTHGSYPFSLSRPPSPLDVTISTTRNTSDKTPFTVYVILVKWETSPKGSVEAWTVSRRFSEFEALHQKLSQSVTNLPSLPAKTWFRSLALDFVEQRRKDLNTYLKTITKESVVLNHADFREFLSVPSHIFLPNLHVPVSGQVLQDDMFGVADFIYDRSRQLILTACEESQVLSRIDARLSNVRFPWEEKGILTPLGSFTIWLLEQDVHSPVNTEYYDVAASCIEWDPVRSYVFIGLENGRIISYKVDLESKMITLLNNADPHIDRVTSIVYDRNRDVLITSSRDKTVRILDVKQNNLVLGASEFAPAWLSSLALDSEQNLAFVANYAKNISIYDVSTHTPVSLHTLQGHKGSVRCVYWSSRERYLFSGGFDHMVGIWSIGKDRSNIHRSRLVGWLPHGPPAKVKAVTFAPQHNVVFVGHENGKIALWNALQGTLIYVFDAHRADVIKLEWFEEQKELMTASKAGDVKFWHFSAESFA